MTGLNRVVLSLTGPKRLRSALRQKTAAISSLMIALDGPGDLRVRIPVAVFGGDIFGVMSQHLREALVVPPPPAPAVPSRRRRHSLPPAVSPFAKQSENFSSLPDRVRHSTLTSETFAANSPTALNAGLLAEKPFLRNAKRSSAESQEPDAYAITQNLLRQQALETSAVLRPQTIEPATSSTAKGVPAVPALVNSLNRYWQRSCETYNTARAIEPVARTEPLNVPHKITASGVEQQPTSSIWPNSITRDAVKRRSLIDDSGHHAEGRTLRAAPVESFADHPVHPGFNFHPANHHAPDYDDLGERIAQILHEQALQHGIDVT